MQQLRELLQLLGQSKGKILILILSAITFVVLLFPFSDLTDFISSQVSVQTNNSVYLQLEELNLSVFPQPGVKLEQVYVESAMAPPISAQELVITPSISGLIRKKPFGHISAKGVLKGDLDVVVSKGAKAENGAERYNMEVTAERVALNDLREMANLPILLRGQLDLQSTILADLSFQEQPDVELNLTINQFELPPSNVNTAMGPLTLPDLKLSTVELKGRLAAGRFIIEKGTIGKQGDELQGTIKGNIGLTIVKAGNSFLPQVGAYNLDIDLRAKKSFQDRAALFLSFIDSYKTPTSEGAQYKFSVNATSVQNPPTIGASR